MVNQPREGAGPGEKFWCLPFLQAGADQKAAPATQKHRENTLEESVFPLQSTATFLNSLEKGRSAANRPTLQTELNPSLQDEFTSLCVGQPRRAWTVSGLKKGILSWPALICVAKKGTKSIWNALNNWQIVSYVICEFLSPRTVKSLWTSAEVMKGRWGGVGRASTRWLACVQDYKRTGSCEHFKFTWGLHQIQHAQGCSFLTSFLWPGRQKSPSSSASPTFTPLRGKRNIILHLLLMQTSQQTTYSTGKLLPPFTTSWKHAGDILLFLHFEQKSRTANHLAKTSTSVHTTCMGYNTGL